MYEGKENNTINDIKEALYKRFEEFDIIIPDGNDPYNLIENLEKEFKNLLKLKANDSNADEKLKERKLLEELEKAKEDIKFTDDLLNRTYELEDQIEELKKENEDLAKVSSEFEQEIKHSFEIASKSIIQMKLNPKKTTKLSLLCEQLYNEIKKIKKYWYFYLIQIWFFTTLDIF